MARELRPYTLDIFADRKAFFTSHPDLKWPDCQQFPLNLDHYTVSHVIERELKESREPLIVTGFAALDRIIDFVPSCDPSASIRVVFGHEPFPSRRETFELASNPFPKEIEEYWLKRGISLMLSAKLIQCIDRLRSGAMLTRYITGPKLLHAKIYCCENSASVGSSNFTRPGMESQLEANARFLVGKDSARYKDLKSIAENYWKLGRDYNDELIALLEKLLRVVSWREALARACAELLEGEWAQGYLRNEYLPGDTQLWPSQRQGIAQALYILSRQGSVLVADATGSGKTRMGIHLIRAVLDQIIRSGRIRQGKSLMVCPPVVAKNWTWESHLSATPLDIYSHGSLSHTHSDKHELTVEALRRAQILCVDEGHNFLNINSNRTQHLLRNMADHVLIFTATPINRSVVDLLRIADMLGADNLDPSTIKAFEKMLRVRDLNRSLTEDEIDTLRTELQRFTLRRTKKILNRMIDQEPNKYLDKDAKPCRFPKHVAQLYSLRESESDCRIATEIRVLADKLNAALHFVKPIEMPDIFARQKITEEVYLRSRLESAKKIARYIIMATLRSSRIALAEHIVGTKEAAVRFGLEDFTKHRETGKVVRKLESLAGKPPINKLSVPLPDWLTDPEAHKKACEYDKEIYQAIYEKVYRLSDSREKAKADLLIQLISKNNLILAFDSRPITLAEIERHLRKLGFTAEIIIATGDPTSQRNDILEYFNLGSDKKNIIGLCSDSLAEGVNLQQASALVHLDMPSVVRKAEQRAGRVDRMDSPHHSIEAWWPDDAPEFALSSDERFIERYETVETLLGSNLPLPEGLLKTESKPLRTKDLVNEYEEASEKEDWVGIHDAFEPVRNLVEGNHALVDQETYERYRKATARVLSRVSLVNSSKPWAFFCLAAGVFGAPRWFLLPGFENSPVTDLDDVCQQLRQLLTYDTKDMQMDNRADEYLKRFLRRLSEAERSLLPRKKQRALEEMEIVILEYAKIASERKDQEKLDYYHAILGMLTKSSEYHQPDWDEVAARWLDLIRPVWYERLRQKHGRPLLLKDIRKNLLERESQLGNELLSRFRSFPVLPPPDERISACIVGID